MFGVGLAAGEDKGAGQRDSGALLHGKQVRLPARLLGEPGAVRARCAEARGAVGRWVGGMGLGVDVVFRSVQLWALPAHFAPVEKNSLWLPTKVSSLRRASGNGPGHCKAAFFFICSQSATIKALNNKDQIL